MDELIRLKKGDSAPDFALQNQDGNIVKLEDFKGKKLLLYFYPKANTPGCTKQALFLKDAREELLSKGVEIVGISPDTPEKQKKFEAKYQLNFPLLSDTEHEVAAGYGVWGEKKVCGKSVMGIIRSSFLIDEEGKIIEAFYKVTPKDTVPKALKALG